MTILSVLTWNAMKAYTAGETTSPDASKKDSGALHFPSRPPANPSTAFLWNSCDSCTSHFSFFPKPSAKIQRVTITYF